MKNPGLLGALAVAGALALLSCGKPVSKADAGTTADGGTGGGTGGGAGGGTGGGAGGGSGGGTGSHPVDTFCASYAQAFCARLVSCGMMASADLDSCTQRYTGDCGTGSPAGVKAGLRTFDAAAAASCLAAIPSDFCGDIGSKCGDKSLFPGSVATGGACKVNGDCQAGTCDGATETTCGSCLPFAAPGTVCGGDAGVTCAPTDYCAALEDGGHACAGKLADGSPCATRRACVSGTCNYDNYLLNAEADAGRTCGAHAPGAKCADTGDCLPGSWCAGYTYDPDSYDTLTDGTCTVSPDGGSVAADGVCSGDSDCADGLWCQSVDGAADGKCVQRGGEGADCSQFMDYVFFGGFAHECQSGYGCGESGCVKQGEVGDFCDDFSKCKALLSCPLPLTDGGMPASGAPIYGRCSLPQAVGTSCMGDGVECAAGTFCDDSSDGGVPSFLCTALRQNGQGCSADAQCVSGSCGSSGSCAAPLSCQ